MYHKKKQLMGKTIIYFCFNNELKANLIKAYK